MKCGYKVIFDLLKNKFVIIEFKGFGIGCVDYIVWLVRFYYCWLVLLR